MRHLQKLTYWGFPAAVMPRCFPVSLKYIKLYPLSWERSVPEGLRDSELRESLS